MKGIMIALENEEKIGFLTRDGKLHGITHDGYVSKRILKTLSKKETKRLFKTKPLTIGIRTNRRSRNSKRWRL